MSSSFDPNPTTHQMATAASVVSGATFISRVLGYVRDMIIAHGFGAGLAADAFFVAFRIPNMARELLGEGALSAAFIPVFTGVLTERGRASAFRMATTVFWMLALILVVICAVGIVGAPFLVNLMAFGWRPDPEKLALTIALTRTMFPYLFFIGLTALMMGVLNSLGHFAAPALSPALLNIAIILSLLFLGPHLQEPVYALAYGVLWGGLLQLLCQFPPALSRGAIFTQLGQWRDPALRRIGRLMAPGVAGLGITQLNVFITTLLASFLVEGSVSYLYYAFRLVHLPIGLVGVAVATVAFPAMSAAAARHSSEELKKTLVFALRLTFFVTIPALLGLLIFRSTIIHLLFERGAFTGATTAATAQVLLGYCLGLCFFVANRVLVPAFHALQDTATPVKAGGAAVVSGIFFSLLLMGPLRATGLALATSLASAVNFSLLLYGLRKRLGPLGGIILGRPFQKTISAGVLMAGTLLGLEWLMPPMGGEGSLSLAVRFLGEFGVGVAVFLGTAALLRSEEVRLLREIFHRRLRKNR
ncbi:MAG: murein biosynthesis integral membrane protein MurJ [Candidatus Methylomirabilales bacterium]